jgi:hypothetical protein
MVFGMTLQTYTDIHVILSLIGIGSGLAEVRHGNTKSHDF